MDAFEVMIAAMARQRRIETWTIGIAIWLFGMFAGFAIAGFFNF
jgi:hypothetical protein